MGRRKTIANIREYKTLWQRNFRKRNPREVKVISVRECRAIRERCAEILREALLPCPRS
jgi:hypothetical protein